MAFHPQPLFFLVVGLVAGTLVPASASLPPLFLALGLAGLIAITAVASPGRVSLSALMMAAAAAGAALAAGTRIEFERVSLSLPVAVIEMTGAVLVEGRLVSDPKAVDGEMRFDVQAEQIAVAGQDHPYHGRIRVLVRSQTTPPFATLRDLLSGDAIRIWVDLRQPQPVRSPGGFDQLEWARREGIHLFGTCKSERLVRIIRKRPSRRSAVEQARDRLQWSWRHVEDPLNRSVTASMVVGDEGGLDARTRDDFRSAGLLHLLVVSGSQVAALIVGLRRILPMSLRISWLGCLIECLALVSYCLVAGAGNSIARATVMAVAFSIAVRLDLSRGGANFLAASAVAVLAFRPLDARDPGAQLSFAATLALVTFARPVARSLQQFRIPGLLADIAAATLVASIAVLPLTLIHFHRLTLIALPVNLVAAPLAAALLYASLLTALLDTVSPTLASLGGTLCEGLASTLRSLAEHGAEADPDWRGPGPPVALVVAVLAGFVASGWRRKALPIAGLLATLTLSGLPRGDGRLHLWFLDVGQGDALLIETPSGRVAAIDAGPAFDRFDSGERVVAEALWALGHRRLEFLAITHRHADHQGGAPFLARHFAPDRVYTNGALEQPQEFETITLARGDAWTLDGVSFRVLGPDPAWNLHSRDENTRSLVIELRYGRTQVLLLGDATTAAEGRLDLHTTRYDLVKVGHHGAKNSSSEPLVRMARPRIALISVGHKNRFDHPAAAVVHRWAKTGALVWRTDLRRTLHITSDGSRLDW